MSDNDKLAIADQKRETLPTNVLPRTLSTQQLFDGSREIYIEHDGEIYRLRITRRNKLILQK